MQDHYQTLGVGEGATADEIKTAYRKLAMQWHPDRNQNNSAATEKFKQINEAYETIGDQGKRERYDTERRFGSNQGHPGGFNFNFNMGGGMPGGFDDIFAQIFGNNSPFRQPQRNRDLVFNLNISMEEAFAGKNVPLQFKDSAGHPVNIAVTIPAGVDNGAQMRYAGHGDRQHQNLPPGDLYINISISEHERFSRSGPHLHAKVIVDALDAIVGTQIEMICIDGQKINIRVPAGSQPNNRLVVRGKGMPVQPNSAQRGDLHVEILITIPTNLSPEAIATIKTLKN